jgi:ribosomal protein L32
MSHQAAKVSNAKTNNHKTTLRHIKATVLAKCATLSSVNATGSPSKPMA